jgi:hypothetical protein
MASSVLLAGVQQSLNYQSAIGQITAILANYGLSLPAVADQTTGQISAANVTALLASISPGSASFGPDINGRRAADAATMSQLLAFVGLSGSALSALPATITASGALTSTNQIVNGAGTVAISLPSPASMVGQPIVIKTIAAQLVNSASANVVPIGGGAAGTAILAGTIGKWAALVSDGTNYQIMQGN